MKSYYQGPFGSTIRNPRPADDDTAALAMHEAAHVVVGSVLGCHVDGIEIGAGVGRARMDAPDLSALDRLTVMLAGGAASNRYPGRVSSDDDEADAATLASQHFADPEAALAQAATQAARLVDQHWQLITRVALELRQRDGVMSGADVLTMLPARERASTRSQGSPTSWVVLARGSAIGEVKRVGQEFEAHRTLYEGNTTLVGRFADLASAARAL